MRRFPRGLRAALAAFTPDKARAAFLRGEFTGWLLSPRNLVELEERRVTLLSLLEARIAGAGEAEVSSL